MYSELCVTLTYSERYYIQNKTHFQNFGKFSILAYSVWGKFQTMPHNYKGLFDWRFYLYAKYKYLGNFKYSLYPLNDTHREKLLLYRIQYKNSLKYKVGCFWRFSYAYTIN